MKADLHNHSTNSPDGGATYKQIVDAACKNGVKYLGITDHDYQPKIEDMLQIDSYAAQKGIDVFLGVENTTEGGVHVQSFYTSFEGKENVEEVKQHLTDRKNNLTGIDQAGELMYQIYKSIGYDLPKEEIKELVGKESYQTLFFFTALGEKFPELHGKGFATNRSGAKKAHSELFDEKCPSTIRYSQTTCDFGNMSGEFKDKLKSKYGLTIPGGSSDFNTEATISLIKKYSGLSVLAHPGMIDKEIFESNIDSWIKAGLTAISCEGYPYEHMNKGIHKSWTMSQKEFNEEMRQIAEKNNLATSGGTDSHQSSESFKSFNGLLAGENAFEATNNKLIPLLLKTKREFYKGLK